MSLLFKMPLRLFAPETPAGNGGAGNTGLPSGGSKEDMIDFLNADDDDKEVIELEDKKPKAKKEEKEPKGKVVLNPEEIENDNDEETDEEETDEDEDDELKEIEDELKEPTEEDLELVTPVRRREILKKYPNLFKDFPYLEKAYYREQQFTEIFPTIPDAREASEKSQVLDKFEADVIQGGNLETILKAVKTENPESFLKIADNYLTTLANVDQNAYMHILGNLTKHTIISMVQEAQKSNNEPLRLAAQILNQFVFGSSDFSPPTRLSKGEAGKDGKPAEDVVKKQQQEWTRRQFDTTLGDLNTKVSNTLRNTIEANIDPKQSMTEYVRKNASRDALEQLNTLIKQDSRFGQLIDKLWEKAFEDNFSKDSVDRIKSAHLAKAKSLLPTVIKKARNEALRGMGKRVKDDDTDQSSDKKKGPITPGRPQSQRNSGGKASKPSEIPRGMSTLDFLNSD